MNTFEPMFDYDKLSDKGIVRIILSLLLASLVLFVAIGTGGALGIVPNTCTGPGQYIMHARCEGPNPMTIQQPFLGFYPGYTTSAHFSETR